MIVINHPSCRPIWEILLLVLACYCIVPSLASATDADETNRFPYHAVLDDNYSIKWEFNVTHIKFQVKVRTQGWVGFGVSTNGNMYPGDMVIGWKVRETVHFHDRHAKNQLMPEIDSQQDWNLLDFKRNDSFNIFTVVRKLETCDDEDIPIKEGTTRVIYAYSDAIPESDDNILYHGTKTRGSKSILLLDPPPLDSQVNKLPDDVINVDFLKTDYPVPRKDTTYACTIKKFPQLNKKHHLIRYEPVIQKGHEKLIHHFVLYYCTRDIPEQYLDKPYECYANEPLEIAYSCGYTVLAWAIGGAAFDFPAHVGYSMGAPEDPVYYKLEVHYDNVEMRADLTDNSGLRMFLTQQLRQHDAAMLEVGTAVNHLHIIPPGMPEFLSKGYCPPACIEKAVGDGEINIFADLLHSHLIGKRLATRHIRNGVELPPIMKDDHYDFDYQESRMLVEERVVQKGDSLMTDCYYDSTKRTTVTYGGLGSREEMCISFLLYYPKINLTDCFTRPIYTKNGKPMYPDGVRSYVENANWTSQEVRDEFARNVLTTDVMDFCYYENEYENYTSSQPRQFEAYEPEDLCLGGAAPPVSSCHLVLFTLFLGTSLITIL